MGEGIDDPSSMWGTTKGIAKKFGKSKVLEMPVSENGLIGSAIGASYLGSRPVINLQRVEFSFLALEQIFNNAAKSSYLSLGKLKVPIVIRLVIGRGWGQGPQHSQSFESLFASIPGLKVVMPTFPHEAKGLMNAAIKDNNPVIFLEHRWLHHTLGNVTKKYYTQELNSPIKINKGDDITVVSSSYSTIEALEVCKFLKKNGINADLFNLCVIKPLNIKLIEKSVLKSRKLITIDTGYKYFGVGSEIISRIIEKNTSKNISVARLGLDNHPTPSSRYLIENYYPTPHKILNTVLNMLDLNQSKVKDLESKFKILFNENKINDTPYSSFKGPF